MIPIGKKNKSLLLGAAAILILLFVSFSATNGSTSSVNSLSKGSSELSNNAGHAAGDKNLLSGANINQEATAPDSETPVKHSKDKTNVVSGSDASLKSKDDSIKKADDSNIDSAGTFVESDNAASKKGAAKGSANKADEKSTTKGKSAVSANDYDYVIMVDAGSTGSRVHVYSFDTSVSPPALINEEFEMLKPGLSSFDTDATGAAASLDPLLELALAKIPKDKHKCSPVAVKATAGLRLLGKAKSDAILKEVRKHLESVYPFPVVEGDGISIMDGSDEGVYAWITTNYLLNNIGTSKRLDTAAVFDLGGGSTQIVFEPTDGTKVLEGEHKYDIEFGGRKFVLYQYSHLGYGLMQARNKVNAEVLKAEMKSNSVAKKLTALTESQVKTAVAEISIEHPCVPQGVNADNVIVELEDGNKYVVNFIPSTNDKSKASASGQCKFLTDSILQKDVECESKSCSFNGVYQPAFKDQFSSLADMYVFSYFYDRLQPIGMPDSFTLKEMNDIMTSVCAGSHLWDTYFKQKSHIKELEDEPLWCLDLNFMISLLHTGYDIPSTRELKTAKTIGGNELGWCLGASLPLLDKTNWKCRVTKDF